MPANNNALFLCGIRSALNVGAIARSAVAFGVNIIYVAPGTPYPRIDNDHRLPHVIAGAQHKIAKTALGAEAHIEFIPIEQPVSLIQEQAAAGVHILCLEQHSRSVPLHKYQHLGSPWLLVVGHERSGINSEILELAQTVLEIKHAPEKESLNVGVATGIALFWLHHGANKQ